MLNDTPKGKRRRPPRATKQKLQIRTPIARLTAVMLALITFTGFAAQLAFAQETPPISFVGEVPTELSWKELQQGYPIRIQNNGSQVLQAVAFRLRTVGLSFTETQKLSLECEGDKYPVPLMAPTMYARSMRMLFPQKTDNAVVNYQPRCKSLYSIAPNLSNVFMLKANGEKPIDPFKVIVLINEFNRKFPISKQISINTASPIIATVSDEARTIIVTAPCISVWPPRIQVRCTEPTEQQWLMHYEKIGVYNSQFVLQTENGVRPGYSLTVGCDEYKHSLVLRLADPPAPVPSAGVSPTASPLANHANRTAGHASVSTAKPCAATSSFNTISPTMALYPGVYSAKLYKIMGPSGNPVSLTVQIRRPWWWAIGLALIGVILGITVRRITGVINPTELMLTRIHQTIKRLFHHRESLRRTQWIPSGHYGYTIDAALELRARWLEQQVRSLRASTTLSLNEDDEAYKQLIKDIAAFQGIPDRWYELLMQLAGHGASWQALCAAVPRDPKLQQLATDLKACYTSKEVQNNNTLTSAALKAHDRSQALYYARETLAVFEKLATLWETARQQLEEWQRTKPAIAMHVLPSPQRRSVLLRFWSALRSSIASWVRWLHQRPKVFGNAGFSIPSLKDVIAFVVPIVALMIAAYFGVYSSIPGFGSTADLLKALVWGLGTDAAVQVFYTIIDRMHIGKLFIR